MVHQNIHTPAGEKMARRKGAYSFSQRTWLQSCSLTPLTCPSSESSYMATPSHKGKWEMFFHCLAVLVIHCFITSHSKIQWIETSTIYDFSQFWEVTIWAVLLLDFPVATAVGRLDWAGRSNVDSCMWLCWLVSWGPQLSHSPIG